jgi:hypothetical protein
MFQRVTQIAKYLSLPVLLVASMLSRFAARYEVAADLALCLGTVVLIHRAVRQKDYPWAAGLMAVAIAVSPLLLVDRIFVLMGFTCILTVIMVAAAFRPQTLVIAR